MNKFLALALASASLAAIPGAAQATDTITGTPSVIYSGAPQAKITGDGYTTGKIQITPQWLTGTWNGDAVNLFTYCIDIKQGAAATTFDVVSLLDFLGGNQSLYNKFAALIAAEGTSAGKNHDASVQLAIWELFYETTTHLNVKSGQMFSGTSYESEISDFSLATTANSFLYDAKLNAAPHPEFQIWVAKSATKQDLLFWTLTPEVPEPASWAMMILGLGAVGCSMRASRRKVAVSFG